MYFVVGCWGDVGGIVLYLYERCVVVVVESDWCVWVYVDFEFWCWCVDVVVCIGGIECDLVVFDEV